MWPRENLPHRLFPVAPMLGVVVVHAGVLIFLGAVSRPLAVAGAVLALLFVHLALILVVSDRMVMLWGDVASQLTAAAVVGLDGGTESPFFFWVLLFLAGQALRHRHRNLAILSAVALGSYILVVALTGDLTASSAGRFGLLLAFCGALLFLRRFVDTQEADARRLDQVLRAGFDSAPVGVVMLDENLRPLYFNEHASQLMNLTEWGGSGPRILDEGGDSTDFMAYARQGFEAAMPEAQVVRVEDGRTVRHMRVLSVPVDIELTRVLLVFAEDVTDQVTTGEERKRFLQAAAHQFRTPLTPVMAYAHMLAEGEMSSEEAVQAGGVIYRGARDLERLLEKLAALLRPRSAGEPVAKVVAIKDVCSTLEAAASDLGAEVQCMGDPRGRLHCTGDTAAVALVELVRNGVLHGQPPVMVTWSESEGHMLVAVSDGGEGPPLLDGAELGAVWSVEYPSAAVSERMGTQLGLSQAVALTELAGGTLSFERDGQGWRFLARFPAARPSGTATS